MLHFLCDVFLLIPGWVCCSEFEEIERGEEERLKKRPTKPLALLKTGSRIVLS